MKAKGGSKGRGGRGGRGGGGNRAKKDSPKGSSVAAVAVAVVVPQLPMGDGGTQMSSAALDVNAFDSVTTKNEDNSQIMIDYDEDIFKLEAPTFTTIDRGPPEPVHRNLKLRWDYEVNLIGQKVLNPTIHVCLKCNIPILIYGRMIPCKHVFCHDCAKKAEKVCPRCSDKVNRVEQVMLGTLFMCTHGGSGGGAQRSNGSESCSRTYLSQRDLQAHINHRHLRQPNATEGGASSTSTTPTKTVHQLNAIDVRQQQQQHTQMQQRHQLQNMQVQQSTQHLHTGGHGMHGSHQVAGSSSTGGSHQMTSDYRSTGRRSNEQSQYRVPPPPQTMSVPPPSMTPYVVSDHHRAYDRQANLMVSNPQTPQPVMPPTYSLNLVSQSSQVANIGMPPPSAIFGTSQMPPIVNSSVVAVAANMVNASRTNLITVPIHDDSSGLSGHSATEYLQYNPHQLPPQSQQQQQTYMQQSSVVVQQQYSGPPPPISYGTAQTYGSTVVTTAFPLTQAPPNTHYPPPLLYGAQQAANIQQQQHAQSPQCYSTQPPPSHRYPISAPRYDDHSQLGSPQYTHVPTAWTGNATQHNICVPPPSMSSLGPPPQPRPPFYH